MLIHPPSFPTYIHSVSDPKWIKLKYLRIQQMWCKYTVFKVFFPFCVFSLWTLPCNLPNVVELDIVSGEAEVGDGVDQHDVLAEQPLHEAVQQAPAELATSCNGPNLHIP